MLKLFISIIIILNMAACNYSNPQKKVKTSHIVKKDPSKIKQAINKSKISKGSDLYKNESAEEKKARQQNTTFTPGAPQITKLPFGPKGWPRSKDLNFYLNLAGKNLISTKAVSYKIRSYNKIYHLPEIKTIDYLNIDSTENYNCNDGRSINKVLTLTKYRMRLPNYGIYECYFMTNAEYDPSWDYSSQFLSKCVSYVYQYYGYLILYNPRSKAAIVIDILHSYYVDSVHERNFYIDRSFNIYLLDQGFSGGEEVDGEITASLDFSKRRKITISKTGNIKIAVLE